MSKHLLNSTVFVAILAIALLAPPSVCSAKPDTGSYTSFCATQQSTVTRTKKTDAESGFSWTDVQNGTLHGVEINGETIIPCKFTSINYFLGRFSAIIAGSPNQAACYKPDGTVLIDLKYGYEGFSMTEDSPYCSVIKKGCSGLYNLDRKEEIIPPTYESVFYSRSSSTSSGVASSTSSSSLSSSSSSSSYSASSSSGLTSDYGSLLFEGVFTFTGQTIQNLQIVNTGVTFTTSFTIYENVLIPKGDGIARYVGNEDFFTVDCRKYVTVDNPDIFYYVNRVGVVYLGMRTTESYPFVGTITSVGYMILEPGDTRSQHSAVPQSGYNNGYSNGGDKASKEQMYRNQYAQWEKTVISHWNSLTSMRDGAARTSMRMNFRNAQSQMRQVRQNAQMEGISITASAWETASVPLGYE